MSYSEQHIAEAIEILKKVDTAALERMVDLLVELRSRGGRLFLLGVGGGAGSCSHAVNDFRKIAGIESYAPTDNVSELTARTNDEGWATVFVEWLKVSRLKDIDMLLVLSVGGGNLEKGISPNLVSAIQLAQGLGTPVIGIVGRDGGFTARAAAACIVVPTVNAETVTPHTESLQVLLWHLLVSHPRLKARQTKWESTAK
jgi:D-sedoheptulose 7-phosphate isomerase